MEFLSRDQIDTKKWDERIAQDPIENIFCYSWYLDTVATHWGAYIEGDFETIIPIPYTNKLGIKSIYNPPFTRELDIFGGTIQWEELMIRWPKMFKGIHLRNREQGIFPRGEERIHQFIDLQQEIKYSTNAKRLIRKAKERFHIVESANPKELIELFKETTFSKIDSITNADLITLEKLMTTALRNGSGELFEVHADGAMHAGGFFLKDKKRITYLKGAATAESKKDGAMFFLMDYAIEKYKEQFNTFDFGGSDIENVANFYKKFGATDRTYYNYTIDNLPIWFKTLKRFKG